VATFVLIPGADGRAWYWHRVEPELRRRGHDVVAVDLPVDDEAAGLAGCADAAVAAIAGWREVVLVAQSLAGFVAPQVCERVRVRLLVLLNAMVPLPGETAGEWWDHVGHEQARVAAGYAGFDLARDFFHDVPSEVTARAMAGGARSPSARLFGDRWPLDRWPAVPTRFLQGRDDRFFPLAFQRRVVRERLGLEPDEMPGGHLLALSQPEELAHRLDAYSRERPGATA
jgi:pimeloyl-ACP methyl ester carboxylesterase